MKLMRPVRGAMIASMLACGSEGPGTTAGMTAGSSSSTDTTGEPATTTATTEPTPTTTEPTPTTTSPGTTDAPTTADGTTTTGLTTADTTDTGSSSEVASSSSGESNGSQCESAGLAICEGFEDADDGAFPAGWGARGDEWGEGVIGVASDDARRGLKALKVDGGNNGQHFMDYKGPLGELASHHYGRVFLKVAVPAPWPADGVLHADFIEGLGPGPKGGTHNVRWGVVEFTSMMMSWIYNVQPSNGDPEFAESTPAEYTWTGEWQCIEWFYDEPSQSGSLWIDDVLLPNTPGQSHAAEIPVFSSLGVGLANYQAAGAGFTVWFDELAYDPERIGCDR